MGLCGPYAYLTAFSIEAGVSRDCRNMRRNCPLQFIRCLPMPVNVASLACTARHGTFTGIMHARKSRMTTHTSCTGTSSRAVLIIHALVYCAPRIIFRGSKWACHNMARQTIEEFSAVLPSYVFGHKNATHAINTGWSQLQKRKLKPGFCFFGPPGTV